MGFMFEYLGIFWIQTPKIMYTVQMLQGLSFIVLGV
jgi:hypothetical protein